MAYSTLYDYYKGLGQSLPSLQTRSQLYQQYGLGSSAAYAGTADQNTQLLNYLQKSAAPAPTPTYVAPTSTPKIAAPTQTSIYSGGASYSGGSVVDFLSAAGQPTDYNSRLALATKYGIPNYTGSATQNTQLLNILKSYATGSMGPTGVPTDPTALGGAGTMPSPTSPIDVNSLGLDPGLAKILSANIAEGGVNGDIAGLLSLYGATTEQEKGYDALTSKLTTLMGSLGDESADLQKAMDEQGVGEAYKHVKELNLKAAQLQGELAKFDADTLQAKSNLEDQPIPTNLILGQQAQLQKQRDLTRISKAAELSATIALSQAYQGNAQIGLELASKSVDLKYAPILNQISVLKTQIGIAADKMSRSDATRAKIIGSLLTIKENEINDEKDTRLQIEKMAIEAAYNGAPLSVVNAIRNSTDAVTAASAGSTFLKGNLESTSKSGADLNSNSTLTDFFSIYAPASDGNDPITYAQTVANKLGITPNTPITALGGRVEELAKAIAEVENMDQNYADHNNPGALKFIGQAGGVLGRNGFAKFPTMEAGWQALYDDINAKINRASSSTTITDTQANKGATVAGLSITEFKALPTDVQNFYVNGGEAAKAMAEAVNNVKNGEENADDVIADIKASNMSESVKTYFINIINNVAPDSGGGFLENVGGFFSGAWDGVKNFLGI